MATYMHPRTPEVFEFLKQCAVEQRITTYGEIGKHVGLAARGTAKPLYYIRDRCLEHDLPPLTAIVVRKQDRLPGVGLTTNMTQVTRNEHAKMVSRVFGFDWSSIHLNDIRQD